MVSFCFITSLNQVIRQQTCNVHSSHWQTMLVRSVNKANCTETITLKAPLSCCQDYSYFSQQAKPLDIPHLDVSKFGMRSGSSNQSWAPLSNIRKRVSLLLTVHSCSTGILVQANDSNNTNDITSNNILKSEITDS